MQAIQGNGRCKTCGCKVQPGELRCEPHLVAYQKWLAGEQQNLDDRTVYKPRRNGVLGLHNGEPSDRHAHQRFRLTRGLRAGEELKFDE